MKRVAVWAVVVFFTLSFAPLALVAMFGAPATAIAPAACVITGTVGNLSSSQSKVVETIAGRAELAGNVTRATEVGVDVSLALTQLTNVPPSANEVGPFAFDPNGGWGPSDIIVSLSADAELFMVALTNDPTWTTGPIPMVAHDVMTANGVRVPATTALFAKALKKATKYSKLVITMASSQGGCGAADGSTLAGVSGSGTLPPDYQIPASATPQEAAAISAALSQVGNAYVWGAASPAIGFDCSGLVMWAWAQANPPFLLDHYTVSQWQETQPLPSLQGASPGDLVLVPGSDGTLNPPNPQHVGMYIGDIAGVPWVVAAADQQYGVVAQTYSSFVSGGLIAVGHIVDGRAP